MATGNPFIDALSGPKWAPTGPHGSNYLPDGTLVLTFYFDQDTSAGHSDAGAWTTDPPHDPLSTIGGEEEAFWSALHAWTSVAKIDFLQVENADAADMIERKVKEIPDHPGADGGHEFPDGSTHNGYYDDSLFSLPPGAFNPGGYSFFVMVHELGHALGLDHPFENDDGRPVFPGITPGDSQNAGTAGLGNTNYTVMSYITPQGVKNVDATRGFSATPMALDIAAIQSMYGAIAHNSGNDVYTYGDKNISFSCIWDTGGDDTIKYAGSADATIDLRPASLNSGGITGSGGWLSSDDSNSGGFTIAGDFTDFLHNGKYGVVIENAIGGTGEDKIAGNKFANHLDGGDGRDILRGREGDDILTGGANGPFDEDTFVFEDGWGNDTITDFQSHGPTSSLGDVLNMFEVTGLGSLIRLQFGHNATNDATITFGSNSIVVKGVTEDQVKDARNFDFTHRVGDGYLSGATVFADANGNGQLDSGEASTTTDANGIFILTGGSGPLIAFGGTDSSTGLAFKGRLSAPNGSIDITPLTTLLVAGANQAKLLSALSLPAGLELTITDPIGALRAGDLPGAKAYAASAKVMDTVLAFGAAIASLGGNDANAQQDAFAVIASVANNLGSGATLDLANATTIAGLFTSVAQHQGIDAGAVTSALASAIATSNAAIDGHLASDGAAASLITDVSAVQTVILANKPPQAVNDFDTATTGIGGTASADAAHGVLTNDSDPDGNALTVTGFTGGTHGNLILNANGSYSYTVTDLTGPTGSHLHDIFTYGITDGLAGVDTATLDITLNRAPNAVNDSTAVEKGSSLFGSILTNDADPDGDAISLTGVVGGSFGSPIAGNYGVFTLNANGSYSYVTSNKGGLPSQYVAQDTFKYTISDSYGGAATATLSVVVLEHSQVYQAGTNTTLNGGNGKDVLDGSTGQDILRGGNGPDVLIGGPGDTLTGGNSPDIFLFRPGFGANSVTDFDLNNDSIQIDKSLFASVADLLDHTSNTAAGAVINHGAGDTIMLTGITLAQLQTHQSDFILV